MKMSKNDQNALIEAFQRNFATKADLNSFATKADLLSFATKADLNIFATKEDLRNFSTKEDLANVRGDLRTEIAEVKSDVLRWLFAFFVTMLLAILGLYFKK
jgi:hypothetical protein